MSHEKEDVQRFLNEESHGSFKSYLVGFILSIVMTFAAYFLVVDHLLSSWILIYTIVGLAILQALAQIYFFFHLGEDEDLSINLMVFAFMALVVVVIVGGSLWIMNHLDERMMPPMKSNKSALEQLQKEKTM